MGLLRRATKEIRALQSEIRAERVRAEKVEEQLDEFRKSVRYWSSEAAHRGQVIEHLHISMDGMERKIRYLEQDRVDLERRRKQAESQFDELSEIHNRVRQQRDQWRAVYEMARDARNDNADDLAEAREVLRALRPVLQDIEQMNTTGVVAWPLSDMDSVKAKLPWLKEWLND